MTGRPGVFVGGLFLSVILASTASAQVVVGRIIDPSVNSGIAGVHIVVLDSAAQERATADTDSLGQFRIQIAEGKYRIAATRLGYQPVTTPHFELAPRELVEVEIRMSANALGIEPLVVTTRRAITSARLEGYYRRLERNGPFGLGRFITRGQIDSFPASHVSHYLARAGLRVVGDAGNARVYSRGCEMAIFVDGMQIDRGMVNDVVSPMDLEGIEIYRSAVEVPAEFMNRTGCGAIVMWTREGETGTLSFWKALLLGAVAVGAGFLLMRF